MSISEEEYLLIVKYLDQSLDDQEKQAFDKTWTDSVEFRQEVEQMEALTAGLKAVEKQEEITEIKEAFREFEQEELQTSQVMISKLPIVFSIAASISILVLFTYLFFPGNKPVNSQSIFNDYYEVLPTNELMRNGDEANNGLSLYSSEKYEEAIPVLLEFSDSSENVMIPLYLANAYLQTDRINLAIEVLKEYHSTGKNNFSYRLYRWYLGLALIKAKKLPEAQSVFNELADSKGIYKKRAIEIIKLLDKSE